MARIRAQEVAALQRALDTERHSTRSAMERARQLQEALDSERSAGRALRREAAVQARQVREEEAKRYAALLEQLRTRMELAQAQTLAAEKEQLSRSMSAQFQRELQSRQEEWRKETRRQLEPLQEQLKEAQRASLESPAKSQLDSLVHSMNAEFHRSILHKHEEWKKETKIQVEVVTCQLRELQRLHSDTCKKLTTITNEAETLTKLQQENLTLRVKNKELEEKIQMLLDADRRKTDEFRVHYEENSAKISDLQRAARKETFHLLEELKAKERMFTQLQKEYHLLATRAASGRSRKLSQASVSLLATRAPSDSSRNISQASDSQLVHQERVSVSVC